MPTALQGRLDLKEQAFIDQVVSTQDECPGALLSILEAVQDHNPHKYLPLDTLRYIAAKAGVPLSHIYSVVTFYALFNLQPRGDNTICICRGTACQTRGSGSLLQSVRLELGLGLEDSSDATEGDKACNAKFRTLSGRLTDGPHSRYWRI
jgi:NADH:ubiquinone oxidoreductase subunit E